jgi:type II secretory pathway component GspD/PulD (secretin)
MLHRSFVPAVAAALALAAAAAAQERPAAEPKRGAYVVKFAGAKDLAAILARHFKGAAEIQTGPDGTSNTLLVSAPPAVFDEVMKTIETLDHKPQTVTVHVFLIEPAAKKDGEKEAGVNEKDLSGAIDDVEKALLDLQKKGQVANAKHIQLSGQEGRVASVLMGESKPYSPTGGRTVLYRDIGTQIRATPEVSAEKTITLDLSVQDARMVIPADGGAPDFPRMQLTSKVVVASGKAVLAKDEKSTDKAAPGRIIIVVGARLVESK